MNRNGPCGGRDGEDLHSMIIAAEGVVELAGYCRILPHQPTELLKKFLEAEVRAEMESRRLAQG
ncbi:MAG: hypothetical protein ACT4OP_00640 [Actinomycetota bacterium]